MSENVAIQTVHDVKIVQSSTFSLRTAALYLYKIYCVLSWFLLDNAFFFSFLVCAEFLSAVDLNKYISVARPHSVLSALETQQHQLRFTAMGSFRNYF